MKTYKKLISIAFCLACSLGITMAQDVSEAISAPQKERRLPREIPNPEKIARQTTDQMQKSLQLTDKQYKKIYKLILKEQKERFEAMQNSGRQRAETSEGEGMMQGGRSHMGGMGMEGGEPPMMGEGGFHGRMGMGGGPRMHGDSNSIENQKKTAEAKEKKIKKILTTEQFTKWKAEQEADHAKAPQERKFRNNHPDETQE